MHVTYSPQRNDRELERKHVDKEIRSGDGGGTDGVHSTGCIELCEPDRVTTAIRIYDDVADNVKSMGAEQRPVLWFAETCVIKWLAPVRADRLTMRRPAREHQSAAGHSVVAGHREHCALVLVGS